MRTRPWWVPPISLFPWAIGVNLIMFAVLHWVGYIPLPNPCWAPWMLFGGIGLAALSFMLDERTKY